MAALISSDFEIPAEISQGIFEKAQKGSTLAQLSGARPQKFGKQQVWVLTSPPKAELVGEAGQKSPTPTAYAHKAVNPFKLQVTMRFSQEVQWADEDVQIGVLQDLASNASIALGRALDLVGIHKINPLTGTVSSLVKEGLVDTKQSVQLAGTKYDEAIEAAARNDHLVWLCTEWYCNGSNTFLWSFHYEGCGWKKDLSGNWIRTESYKFFRNDCGSI